MSDADLAYAAAVAEIARVRAGGGRRLDLMSELFNALRKIPDAIADFTNIQTLN